MGRVLWLSNETPDVHGQGGQRRQYFQVAAAVGAGHTVTVASLDGPQSHESVSRLAEAVRLPSRYRRLLPGRRRDRATNALFSRSFDRVVVAHTESWLTWRDALVDSTQPVLVDMHNVRSAWYAAQGRHREAQHWAQVEAEIARQARAITVCSERELAALPLRARATFVLEHGVAPEEWPIDPSAALAPVIKLFGNWDWAPNRAGLQWFVHEVWPRLSHATDVRCHIAGTGADHGGSTPGERLSFLGRVESVPRFLSTAWIVAIPVLQGMGAPVKFAEALASGAPVVGTRDAVPAHGDWAALVSDDADDWVSWVTEVVANPNPHRVRSLRAREHTLSDLSWSRVSQPLLDWMDAS